MYLTENKVCHVINQSSGTLVKKCSMQIFNVRDCLCVFCCRDGRVMGVLEVSRSIGDGQYKKLGVTCTPDVKKCQLTDCDRLVSSIY